MARPELLAPAGGLAALHAAVGSGADAVYLGLPAFNARRSADNFTLEDFADACAYAHCRGVRVYVALNTVILPGEMEEAVSLARHGWEAGADAFIVQDLGLAARLREAIPSVRLHSSTQMNIHSAAGIRAAARLGASRVTLARELSLGEVEALAAVAGECGLEVEAFVHGALCVCYSGQCLMSSMIGGRSANRGACAQACRLPYQLLCDGQPTASPGEHLLSPADLCAIDLLEDLVGAGVASFKIEGRMKTPEYVGTVVAAYRRVLDAVLANRPAQATDEERTALASAFSRGFTTAYLAGERGNAMMSYQRPNNRGAFVGRVREVQDGRALLALEQPLAPGDLVEFWTRKGHERLTVAEPLAAHDPSAWLPLDGATRSVGRQDRVFKVRSAAAAFADDGREPRIPLTGTVRLALGEPVAMGFQVADADAVEGVQRTMVERLRAAVPPEELRVAVEGPVAEPARTKAVTAAEVDEHVDRLGQTPFALTSLQVELDEGVGIGFSQLHKLRAAALESLRERLAAPRRPAGASAPALASPLRAPGADASADAPSEPFVAALATNPACARAAKRAGAAVVYVPALNYQRNEAQYAGVLADQAEQAGYPKGCRLVMAEAEHDPVGRAREAVAEADPWERAAAHGPLMAEGLGTLQRAADLGIPFEVGPHLPLANAEALRVAAAWGAERAWLTPELNLAQLKALGREAALPLGLAVAGRQVLMTLEHCALMSQGPCDQRCSRCARRRRPHALKDRKGFEFPVVTDQLGRSRVYNSVPLDVIHALPDLLQAGIGAFLVDATLMSAEETAQAVGRAVKALQDAAKGKAASKQGGTTSGHLFRGIS